MLIQSPPHLHNAIKMQNVLYIRMTDNLVKQKGSCVPHCNFHLGHFLQSTCDDGGTLLVAQLVEALAYKQVAGSIPDGVIGILTCICLTRRWYALHRSHRTL
jgi:hypothetical protein